MVHKLSFTGRIASFSFRHRWSVLGAWILLIAVAGVAASGLAAALTTDDKDLSNSDSAQARRVIDARFGQRSDTELLVVRSDRETVDSPAFQSVVSGLTAQLRGIAGVVRVGSYLDSGDASLISADRHAALTTVTLSGDTKQAEITAGHALDALKATPSPSGYQVHLTGIASSSHELNAISEKDISKAEQIGLPVALLVLVLAFGSAIAVVVPLLLAFAAIAPALGAVALIGRVFQLSFFITNIITMIGLAVGIDYSLFIIGRYREELAQGHVPAEALAIAADSSGRAVFFSGITVLLALAGMLFVRDTIFVSIGIGAMVVVLFAIAASLTLLPAVLSLFGRGINRLRVPLLGRAGYGGRFWSAVTHQVQEHPIVSVVLSAGLLLAAASGLIQIDLGSNGVEALPHNTDAYQGIKALQADFAGGLTDPMHVVISGDVGGASIQGAIGRLHTAVGQRSNLRWAGVQVDRSGHTAIVDIATTTLGTGADARQAVTDLRSTLIPQAFNGTGADVHLGGNLPAFVDVKGGMDSSIAVVFSFVLGLSFLLLLVVFRSVVIPAKAIVMNLLSVGAAYGLIVLVFQKGLFAGLLGFHKVQQVEFWLPLFLFSILFGLSMDYHVFLLSRVQEEYHRRHDNREAVAAGVRSTAGMITSAAIIMVAVFFAFSRGSMVSLQQMGFGLAVAIFLDATVIRTVLVPASMQLLGHWNWWLPSWLAWLPKISVEGHAVEEPAPLVSLPLAAAGD